MLGRPVVASRAGGLAELIDDGVTGRLVPPGNSAALAATISEVLNSPSAAMGAKASATMRERFAPESFTRRIVEIYDNVLAKRATQASSR